MQRKFIQVSTTVDSKARANRIATRLLRERVASCVQVFGPISSSYWWNGEIESLKEWYCLIKGRAEDYQSIEASIRKIHSYKVPEILATPILHGNPDYLRWIRTETNRDRRRVPLRPVKKKN